MKTSFMLFNVAFIFLLSHGGDDKAATIHEKKKEAATNEKQSAASPSTSTSPPTTSADGIVGTWKLILDAFDDNFNTKLDDEERKKGVTPQSLPDFQLRFNADGSCKMERNYPGSYKISEEGGSKILSVHLDATERLPPGNRKYHIKSMTGTELLLLREVSGVTYNFWLLKKV